MFCLQFLNGYVSPIIALFGIVGNILSIIVLRSPRMRSPVSIYLLSLAVCDTILLIAAEGLFIGDNLSTNFTQANSSTPEPGDIVMQHVLYPLALTAQMATIWIAVCLTAERFIAGCYPLHAGFLSNIPRARLAVLCCVTCAVVYNLPRWFEFSYFNVSSKIKTNESRGCEIDIFTGPCLWHSTFRVAYYTWGYMLFMFLLPFIAMTYMNSKLIQALRNSHLFRNCQPTPCYCQPGCSYFSESYNANPVTRENKHNWFYQCCRIKRLSTHRPFGPFGNKHSTQLHYVNSVRSNCTQRCGSMCRRVTKPDRNVTRMVIVVVCVFIACQLPAMIYNIYFGITSNMNPEGGWCILSEVRNFLAVVNSSINFVIYSCLGAKFRQCFIHVITPCWEQQHVTHQQRSQACQMTELKDDA